MHFINIFVISICSVCTVHSARNAVGGDWNAFISADSTQ